MEKSEEKFHTVSLEEIQEEFLRPSGDEFLQELLMEFLLESLKIKYSRISGDNLVKIPEGVSGGVRDEISARFPERFYKEIPWVMSEEICRRFSERIPRGIYEGIHEAVLERVHGKFSEKKIFQKMFPKRLYKFLQKFLQVFYQKNF